jgi:hypothetical protein
MQDDVETAWPITDRDAATRLHMGLRRVRKLAAANGIGRRAGKRLIFSERDFDALYHALPSSNEYAGRALRSPPPIHLPSQAAANRRLQEL